MGEDVSDNKCFCGEPAEFMLLAHLAEKIRSPLGNLGANFIISVGGIHRPLWTYACCSHHIDFGFAELEQQMKDLLKDGQEWRMLIRRET